jgi:hypothetical protein
MRARRNGGSRSGFACRRVTNCRTRPSRKSQKYSSDVESNGDDDDEELSDSMDEEDRAYAKV